jgi:hypothetical protein
MAGRGVIDAFTGIAQQGRAAELSMIQMTNAIQTIGEISDYGEAQNIAIQMREQLARIAVELPGGTNDFIAIQTRIMDDMILSLGSVEAVQKDLDKGTESFVGLFGTFARLAGLSPELAARDLDQLRRSPNSTRHVEILTRNANLLSAYMEEIAKTPGDFFSALKRAMERSMTDQTREALKNSFDVAIESFYDTLFNEVRGIFGTMRKAVLKVDGKVKQRINDETGELEDVKLTMMESLGLAMRQIGDTFSALSEIVGLGPLESINSVIFEVGYFFWLMKTRLRQLSASTSGNMDGLMTVVNESITTLFANLTEWIASLDYQQFFHYVDGAIAAMFRGIGIGLGNAKGGTNAVGSTVSGTALAFLALAGAMRRFGINLEDIGNGLRSGFSWMTKGPKGSVKFGKGLMPGPLGRNFMAGLKSVSKGFLILGGVIEFVTDLLDGKSLKESFVSGLGNMGGTALGAAVGTAILPGIGTLVGAVLGGYIGGSDGVMEGLVIAFDRIVSFGKSVITVFDSIITVGSSLVTSIESMMISMGLANDDFSLFGEAIRLVMAPLRALELALLYLAAFIYGLPGGDKEKQAQVLGQIDTIVLTEQVRTMKGTDAEKIAALEARIKEAATGNIPGAVRGGAGMSPEARQAAVAGEVQRLEQMIEIIRGKEGTKPAETQRKIATSTQLTQEHAAKLPSIDTAIGAIDTKLAGTISTKVTDVISARITNLSEIKLSPPPQTTTNTVAPAVTQTAGTTNGGVMLKVENVFNAAEMSEDVMAEKVSASIIRAIDDAGYREVYEA